LHNRTRPAALDKRAGELYQTGRFSEATPLAERALEIREKALDPDHVAVALSLNVLAFLYDKQGRYADAEPLYKRALAITEKALGPGHPSVALSLTHLALLYKAQGRIADAELLHKRALAIVEKALGPDHPNVAPSITWLVCTGRKVATPMRCPWCRARSGMVVRRRPSPFRSCLRLKATA
jgi:tetratricopeptide (TPR) repeat protein